MTRHRRPPRQKKTPLPWGAAPSVGHLAVMEPRPADAAAAKEKQGTADAAGRAGPHELADRLTPAANRANIASTAGLTGQAAGNDGRATPTDSTFIRHRDPAR